MDGNLRTGAAVFLLVMAAGLSGCVLDGGPAPSDAPLTARQALTLANDSSETAGLTLVGLGALHAPDAAALEAFPPFSLFGETEIPLLATPHDSSRDGHSLEWYVFYIDGEGEEVNFIVRGNGSLTRAPLGLGSLSDPEVGASPLGDWSLDSPAAIAVAAASSDEFAEILGFPTSVLEIALGTESGTTAWMLHVFSRESQDAELRFVDASTGAAWGLWDELLDGGTDTDEPADPGLEIIWLNSMAALGEELAITWQVYGPKGAAVETSRLYWSRSTVGAPNLDAYADASESTWGANITFGYVEFTDWVTPEETGSYYFRAYALIDGEPHWSEERMTYVS